MLIFAATNDSVQFHEVLLRTFINRKFSLYLDQENDNEEIQADSNDIDSDIEMEADVDDFIPDEDGDGFELNLKKNSAFKKQGKNGETVKKQQGNKKVMKKKKKSSPIDNNGRNLIDVFALYGNMDQHKRGEILAKYCQSDSGILICTV